ncbi:MAG TPA: MFS transporter [Steroidobacteraceae bacterium]|nr:MFS transporter [Steroidobacteraceae bacterium]
MTSHPDGLPIPRRYWAIVAILLGMMMSVLDSTIANVALPSIARDFDASNAASIWVINAYQVVVLVALLPLSSLGEIVGYRRIMQGGLVVFTLASVACALSSSLVMLSSARVLQGLGAAGMMGVNAALVRFTYPQAMLGRALGINALVVAVSAAIGPTIAAAILAVGQWRWLFAINIPIGVLALAIGSLALPDNEPHPRRLNHVGVALYVGTFGLLTIGLQSFAHREAMAIAAAQVAGAAVLAVLLVRHELGRRAPLLPFDLLRIRLFSLSVATSVCSFIAQMAALVALPFEIQRLGRTAVETGLLMTPWPVGVALAAPIAGRLADRYPAGILGGIGLLMLSAGLALLAFFPQGGDAVDLIWRMTLCGLGFGFFQSPNNRAIVATAPRSRAGAAGGMLSTARLLGQTVGAAGVALFFGVSPQKGSNLALSVAAGVALIAAVVSMLRLHGGAGPTAMPTESSPAEAP